MISLRRWIKKLAAKKEAKEQAAPTLTGRRDRRNVMLYTPADMAKQLSKQTPYFRMHRGVYAVAVDKKGHGIYFIRVDKARGMGKKTKRARALARRLASVSA
jgi:hypothetical protein